MFKKNRTINLIKKIHTLGSCYVIKHIARALFLVEKEREVK